MAGTALETAMRFAGLWASNGASGGVGATPAAIGARRLFKNVSEQIAAGGPVAQRQQRAVRRIQGRHGAGLVRVPRGALTPQGVQERQTPCLGQSGECHPSEGEFMAKDQGAAVQASTGQAIGPVVQLRKQDAGDVAQKVRVVGHFLQMFADMSMGGAPAQRLDLCGESFSVVMEDLAGRCMAAEGEIEKLGGEARRHA